jgi:hypothetical protein
MPPRPPFPMDELSAFKSRINFLENSVRDLSTA